MGVESQPGHGSTFWFTLTLPVDTSIPTIPPPADIRGLRVLIVDGNAVVIFRI
jgi:hypothetical protein